MTCVEVRAGDLLGFKALTLAQAEAVHVEQHNAAADWAAVYPQTSLQSALDYLPNQFERGHSVAQLVALYALRPFKLVVYSDPAFTQGSVSSQEKASRVRTAYNAAAQQLRLPTLSDAPLMHAFGEADLALCVLDAEDFEFVIPHSMFTSNTFRVEVLFTLHQSERQPWAVGRVDGLALDRHTLEDCRKLGEELSKHAGVVRCEELQNQIATALASAREHDHA